MSQRWYEFWPYHQDGHFLNRSENPGVPSPQNSWILLINSPIFQGNVPFCGVRWNHHFFPVSHNFRLDTHLFLCRRHLQIWFLRKTYQQQKDTYILNYSSSERTSSNHHQTYLRFSFPQGPQERNGQPPPAFPLWAGPRDRSDQQVVSSTMMAFAGSITVSLLAVALFTQMPGWFFDPRVIPNGKDTAIFLQNKTWWTVEIENN